jgi:hypothetical protein
VGACCRAVRATREFPAPWLLDAEEKARNHLAAAPGLPGKGDLFGYLVSEWLLARESVSRVLAGHGLPWGLPLMHRGRDIGLDPDSACWVAGLVQLRHEMIAVPNERVGLSRRCDNKRSRTPRSADSSSGASELTSEKGVPARAAWKRLDDLDVEEGLRVKWGTLDSICQALAARQGEGP